jgi:hypothetical protein
MKDLKKIYKKMEKLIMKVLILLLKKTLLIIMIIKIKLLIFYQD